MASPGVPDDFLAAVRARAHANLYWRYLGVVVEDAKPGWVRLRVDVRDDLRNAANAPVHGGVMSALVDMAVGGARRHAQRGVRAAAWANRRSIST